jgi:restriction endonuclease Mrr
MAIPDFQTIMLPLLEGIHTGEGAEHTLNRLAAYFELTDEELSTQEVTRSQTVFQKNIAEAIMHLKRAGLVEQTNGLQITGLGKQVVQRRLNYLDTQYLRRFPGYLEE